MAARLDAILVVHLAEWKADCSAGESVERRVALKVVHVVEQMVVLKAGNLVVLMAGLLVSKTAVKLAEQ